jgi:hypothetical protein
MPEFAPYSLRVAFFAQTAPITPEAQNRSTGVFGAFSAVWSKKAGANTGGTAHSCRMLKNVEVFAYIGTNRPQPKT